ALVPNDGRAEADTSPRKVTYHPTQPIDVNPKPIASDPTVKYDYDIVYVRAPRPDGDKQQIYWADVLFPINPELGADLMVLHPDGREEVLVKVERNEAVADPMVSFDGEWVYFAKFYQGVRTHMPQYGGSDIYKVHVPTRKVVRLTHREYTPNRGPEA